MKNIKVLKIEFKRFSIRNKRKINFQPLPAYSSENLSKIDTQKVVLLGFEVFRPIGHNANANFKRAPNFRGDKCQKSVTENFPNSPILV